MIGALLAKKGARKTFAAMNRHDLDRVMDSFGEHPVFEFPAGSPLGGRREGREEVRAWFERWWDRFPETEFTIRSVSVENIFALGGTNTLHVEWDLRETDRAGNSLEVHGVTALDVGGGKVRTDRQYIFNPEAVAEAWSV